MENCSHLDESEFQNIAETNLNKISSVISKIGYSDGITEGRKSVFQQGFDAGYKDGLRTAFEISKYKSISEILYKEEDLSNSNIAQEAGQFVNKSKLQYTNLSNEINRDASLDEISTNQNQYIDQKLEKIKTDFPILSNLLE